MPWGLITPSSFGKFFPNGSLDAWADSMTEWFETQLSDAEKELYVNRASRYMYEVGRKFRHNLDPLEPHERPDMFKMDRMPKALGDLILTENGLLAASDRLKDCIEAHDPGVHKFWPMAVVSPKGQPFATPFHGFVPSRYLDSFDHDQSNPKSLSNQRLARACPCRPRRASKGSPCAARVSGIRPCGARPTRAGSGCLCRTRCTLTSNRAACSFRNCTK